MPDETNVQATPDTSNDSAVSTSVTPTDTATQTTSDANATPATPATTEFLRVNDRTVYKTQEDAVKGWTEAQATITGLKEWERIAKEYGVTDPKTAAELFNELVDRRSREAQPSTTSSSSTNTVVADAIAGDKAAYDSLSPEWKAQVDYLQKIGFVTSDKLKPLEQRLSAFEQAQQNESNQRIESARMDGATLLKDKLGKMGLPNDDETVSRVGEGIAARIGSGSYDAQGRFIRGSEEDRFINKGTSERSAILDEHLKWLGKLGTQAATATTASTVAQKTANMANTPRALPNSTSAVTTRKGRMSPEERSAAVNRILEQASQQ